MKLSTVSSRIASAREDRGISASELARLVEVTPTAVWNWEKNGVQPRPAVLEAVSKVLGVSREFLLTGSGASQPSTRTVADIVRDATAEIAAATGYGIDKVKVEVSFTPD